MNLLNKLKKQNLSKNKKGFTLVEIIVVLVILAVLAAAAIPTMLGFVNDARDKQYIAEARTVYVAAQTVATEQFAVKGTDFDTSGTVAGLATSSGEWDKKFAGLLGTDAVGVVLVETTNGKVDRIEYTPAKEKAKKITINAGNEIVIG